MELGRHLSVISNVLNRKRLRVRYSVTKYVLTELKYLCNDDL